MDVVTEAWRLKHPKNWISAKHCKCKAEGNADKEEKEETPKPRKETTPKVPKEPKTKKEKQITLCFHNKKKKFIPLQSRDPSIGSLAKSCNHNCCNCCAALAKYIKEVFRFVYCIVNCKCPPCMRFQQMFGELAEATCNLCSDCLNLICCILRIFVGVKN